MVATELHQLNIAVGEHAERIRWLDANARGTNQQVTELCEGLAALQEWCIILDARLTLIIDALDGRLSPSEV